MTTPDWRRPAITGRAAAKRLGVELRVITGLLTAGQLPGYWDSGKSGKPVAMVYDDAVQALAARMARMTPAVSDRQMDDTPP